MNHNPRLGKSPGEAITVNGHMYVHVAACPCPAMKREMKRLAADFEADARSVFERRMADDDDSI